MPTIGNFATTAPLTGELRVFFTGSAGGDRVRAITISKTAHNNLNVDPSLTELNFAKAQVQDLTEGGISKFIPTSKADKGSYFFFTNEEFIVRTLSGSLSASVVLDPFLQGAFANTSFNPLISNAEIQRPSLDKFDVDRDAGFTKPTNIHPLTGTLTKIFTDFDFGTRNGLNELTGSSSYPFTLNFTSSKETFILEPTNLPVNFKLTKNEIEEVFGIPAVKNVTHVTRRQVDPLTGAGIDVTSSVASYDFNLEVEARVLKSGSNGVGNHSIANHTIYKEFYESSSFVSASYGNVNFTGSGFDFNVTAFNNTGVNPNTDGSITFQTRLKYTVTAVHNGVAGDKARVNQVISGTANENSKNFLEVLAFPANRVPYATRATVPDSNYTATGYSNARYNGTKTTAANFSGVSPAIGANTFKGFEVHPPKGFTAEQTFITSSTVDTSDILADWKKQAVSGSRKGDRLVDLFFDGSGSAPEISIRTVAGRIAKPATSDFWSGSSGEHTLTSTTDTEFILDAEGFQGLEIGDVIGINASTNVNQPSALTERLLVTNVQPLSQKLYLIPGGGNFAFGGANFPNTNASAFSKFGQASTAPFPNLFKITVRRRLYNTVAVASSATVELTPIVLFKGDRIFQIEGSRPVGVSDKFFVVDAENIEANIEDNTFRVISIDDRGFINNSYFATAPAGGVAGNQAPQ